SPGQRRRHIGRKTERFANFAHRAARSIANDGGAKPCAMPAEPVIYILDYFFALLMFEIDVDIGRLMAGVRDEPLQKQISARLIGPGDAEGVADSRIGGRAAPLMQNVSFACEAHDVLNGEEKRRIIMPRDQLEFMFDLRDYGFWHSVCITPFEPFPSETL